MDTAATTDSSLPQAVSGAQHRGRHGFAARYYGHFGLAAPALNSIGESCYEAITLLIALARRAGSLDVAAMTLAAENLTYVSPRGEVSMSGNQLNQDIYVAEALGLDFEVRARISAA